MEYVEWFSISIILNIWLIFCLYDRHVKDEADQRLLAQGGCPWGCKRDPKK